MLAPPNIAAVNTILYCRHFEACVAFYAELGWARRDLREWLISFDVMPGMSVSVADESRARVKSGAGRGLTLTFQVDDLDRLWDAMREAGQAPESIEVCWGARRFFVRDPEGHRLEFWASR